MLSQPKEYDAILGGESQQPKPYDVVLGGKSSVDRAVEALKNPDSYQEAKRFLLAQPKVEQPLLDVKARSWGDILDFYSNHIEVVKELGISFEECPFSIAHIYAEYRFDTPTTTDNRLVYSRNDYRGINWGIDRANFKFDKWLVKLLTFDMEEEVFTHLTHLLVITGILLDKR